MKRVEIIFDESVENEIMMILRQAGQEHWTRFDTVRGSGGAGQKLGNSVGPGINSVLLIYAEPDAAERIVQGVKRFKGVAAESGGHASTQCVVSDVETFV